MAKHHKKQEDHTNYSFLLKCMTALTAAAVVTAGVIAAVSLKSGAATTTTIATKMAIASAFAFTPLFPIALVLIGLVCVLPFLFGRNNTTYTSVRTATPGSNMFGFYSTPSYSTPVYTNSHYHGHDMGTVYNTGNVHGHDSNMHGHDSHTHGHSSSVTVHGHR